MAAPAGSIALRPSIPDTAFSRLAARIAPALPLAAYLLITGLVSLHHEPWRDEADTWLYARDADLPTLVSRFRYMGTPGLWYFLLFPFAKLGFPYATQFVLHLGIAFAAAALFYTRAPLPRLTRLLFLSSYFMAYEYSIVARTYALSVLLIFTAAALYPRRLTQPIVYAASIALLFHTNAHGFMVAAALSAVFACEFARIRRWDRHALSALGLIGGSGALAFLLLLPPPDANVTGHFNPDAVPRSIGEAFVPFANGVLGFIPGIFALAAASIWLKRAAGPFFILWIAYGLLFYVYAFKYAGEARHFGFLLVMLLFALWTAGDERAGARPVAVEGAPTSTPIPASRVSRYLRLSFAALNLSLALSTVIAISYLYRDYRYASSGAREMARFIMAQELTSYTIAAHKASHTESLLPYLDGVRFWYPGLEDYGTYMLWDRAYRDGQDLSYQDAIARTRSHFPDMSNVLLLLNTPIPTTEQDRFSLIYTNQEPVFRHRDEVFYLYRAVR